MSDVTQILSQIEEGNSLAAAELLPLVYDELRRIAAGKMAAERREHTLQPTALVHEAWLRLVGNGNATNWNSRGHFYAAAAEAMRRILTEAARQRTSLKRGGVHQRVDLTEMNLGFGDVASHDNDWASLLSLDEALLKLKETDLQSYQVVMLRYFSGLTNEQVAESMGISTRTAKRNWSYARAWLQREIDGEGSSPHS